MRGEFFVGTADLSLDLAFVAVRVYPVRHVHLTRFFELSTFQRTERLTG